MESMLAKPAIFEICQKFIRHSSVTKHSLRTYIHVTCGCAPTHCKKSTSILWRNRRSLS